MDLFDDIKAYLGFTAEDARWLLRLRPIATPHYARISDHFYERILAHPRAHAAITGGEEQVRRLKRTLIEWMDSGLRGPHDEVYFERRMRIGRVHVRIDLPQRYMITAMDVFRTDLREVVEAGFESEDERQRVSDALDRLLDIDLAIMLETYKEDSDLRLTRRERLATIGQLAASIGHELRNPLGVIESSVYLARKSTDTERREKHLDKIQNQVRIAGNIIGDLMEMARNQPPRRERFVLTDLLDEIEGLLPSLGTIVLHFEVPEGLEVDADRGLVRQALVNLVGNARAALAGRAGNVWIRAGQRDGGLVEITVEDDGPGFPPEILGRAFEPLVTGRVKGVGLGLALVRSIADRHGGSAEASNRPDGGARIRLVIPPSEGAAP